MDGRQKKFILELQKKPKLRRESGLYIIDGPKMAGELAVSDAENVFVTRAFLNSAHAQDCAGLLKEVPYTLVQDSEMKQLSDTVSPQGILVVARQRRVKGLRALLEGGADTAKEASSGQGTDCRTGTASVQGAAPMLLLLETIQDPGNLGTIFRMAEAAGVTGIVMNTETVDPYSPKVVRSTMGALLRLPFVVVEDLEKAALGLTSGEYSDGAKIRLFAACLDGAADYAGEDFRGSCAILIGNESRGLSGRLCEAADRKIRIPMCGNTESLNAAVAAAVICFEAARQRRSASFQGSAE